jgi:signal transduction histidine kinase
VTARFAPSRWTLRVRLTVLWATSFLLAGAVLLTVTYVLVAQSLDHRSAPGGFFQNPKGPPDPNQTATLADGRNVPLSQASDLLRSDQANYRRETLDTLLSRGALALIIVGVLAGIAGWLMAGRALSPVAHITATAKRIAGGPRSAPGLHERIALTGPQDEVKELADTFDAMLERLDRSFDGQRRFVSNASHELRTPLAINRALIEVAITRAGAPSQLVDLGESLLSVNARHERLINGLLTLADSENEITERVPVDLADIARHAMDLGAEEADAVGIALKVDDISPAPATGDPVLLERLISNLIENAIRHNTGAGGWVHVSTRTAANGRVQAVVVNTGPIIPDYESESLFQPFRRRAERTREAKGFGLGLAIVRAVARAHGGDVYARPHEGGGLVVTLDLPGR